MKRARFIFMVYDSRSGSTLVASRIASRTRNVVAIHEIGFEAIFAQAGRSIDRSAVPAIVRRLCRDSNFGNLGIDAPAMEQALMKLPYPSDARQLFHTVLDLVLERVAPGSACPVLLKHGPHILYWRQIAETLGDEAGFIHVFRDPRAVVNSKMHAVRPYQPHETMAWGGSLMAAMRWRQYSRAMRKAEEAGVPIFNMKYGHFVADPEGVLKDIAQRFGLDLIPVDEAALSERYLIPEAEKTLHAMALTGDIDSERQTLWKEQLSQQDRLIVEAICLGEMQRRGFQPLGPLNRLQRCGAILAALPSTARKVAAHYLRR